jgi:hypothetical protein
VGYGAANCSETAAPASLGTATAAIRDDAGCEETNNNSTDFTLATPTPRNSASPIVACSCSANESDQAYEADYCNLQSPATISVAANATTGLIYGRIFEAGLTATAGAPPGVLAQVGWGATTINPSIQSGFQYVNATYNVQVGNDDEFQASLTPTMAGTYSYVYRFSLDGGAHWTYCDLDGAGSNSGLTFDTAQFGTLTVTN